jgi:uncharacterized protein
MKNLKMAAGCIAACMLLAAPAISVAAHAPGAHASRHQHAAPLKVVIQMSDNNPGKWNLALNNARNIQDDIGKANAVVELVAYGPGINMLKMDSSVGNRIAAALADGVKVNACQNTMHAMHLTPADMLQNITYVPSGAVEILRKQQQGYSYLRP